MNWTTLTGILLPPVIDLINMWIKNNKIRFLVSMVVCFGFGYLIHMNEITTVEEFLSKGGIIFTEAQIIYKLYWEKSGRREKMIRNFTG